MKQPWQVLVSLDRKQYGGTSLSHYTVCLCCRSQGCRAELLLLCCSSLCGREAMERWLCLLTQCQHSSTGVEAEVTCARKRAGTDYIIRRVRGRQGPHWDWVTAAVRCSLCGHQDCASPFIQGRVRCCWATLWFFAASAQFNLWPWTYK